LKKEISDATAQAGGGWIMAEAKVSGEMSSARKILSASASAISPFFLKMNLKIFTAQTSW